MRYIKIVLVTVLLLSIIGCASGPGYHEVSDSFGKPGKGEGRVFFYRDTTLGAAITPDIKLDGTVVGESKAEGFFYKDCPAGNHTVATSTEVERTLSFTLDEGETKYVKFGVSLGFLVGHVYPELVDTSVGEKEIQDLKFSGLAK